MTGHPGYLEALARAAGWEHPQDQRTDAAHPRPRSLFEPDGPELAAGEGAWGEAVVEAEPRGVAAPPPPPAPTEPATPALPPEREPTAVRTEVTATATQPGERIADAPSPAPAERPPREAATVEQARPARRVLPTAPPEPPDRQVPSPSAPARTTEAPAAARDLPEYTVPEATTSVAAVVAVPLDPPDRGSPRERPPEPEPLHEARPVVTPDVAAEATAPIQGAEERDGEPTVVVVEIGRIEVRLGPEPGPVPRPAAVRPTPGPSLADYLRDRSATEGRPA